MIDENSTPEQILSVLNSGCKSVKPGNCDTILIKKEKLMEIRRIIQSGVLSSYSNHVGVDTDAATDGITGLLIVLDFAHSLTVEALEKGTITEKEAQSIFDALNPLLDGYEFE